MKYLVMLLSAALLVASAVTITLLPFTTQLFETCLIVVLAGIGFAILANAEEND